MNVYHLDLSGDDEGIVQASIKEVLKAIGYFAIYGENITPYVLATKAQEPTLITFELPFALSNLSILDKSQTVGAVGSAFILQTLMFDSSIQGVNEMTDKPYAMQGYYAVSFANPGTSGDPSKDMDNFLRFNAFFWDGAVKQGIEILVGKLNSSLTDAYTPLENCTSVIVEAPKLR